MNNNDNQKQETSASSQDEDADGFLNHEELLAATLAELLAEQKGGEKDSKPPEWLVKGYGHT